MPRPPSASGSLRTCGIDAPDPASQTSTSTAADPTATVIATSPPPPDPEWSTELVTTSLTRRMTSSDAGCPSPRSSLTRLRAIDTDSGTPLRVTVDRGETACRPVVMVDLTPRHAYPMHIAL